MITTTNHRLQPLYDCLLTIIVNISPYIKTLGMVASTKLMHLLEALSTSTFLLSNSSNYYLVFFILEILNNIIQYQFDGNYNLVYTIIRKRNIFFNLLNLPVDQNMIDQIVDKKTSSSSSKKLSLTSNSSVSVDKTASSASGAQGGKNTTEFNKTMDGATPAKEAEPGTLKATLIDFPSVMNMTEKTLPTTANNNVASKDKTTESENTEYSFFQDNPNHNTNNDGLGRMNSDNSTLIQLKQQSNATTSTTSAAVASSSTSTFANFDEAAHNSSADSSNLNTSTDHSEHGHTSSSQRAKKSEPQPWSPTSEWVSSWKSKLPLQTIMRLLQVLVPQVEKICIDKGLTDESEILKFLQNGTLVGLLPVPHPILIRKYQPNVGTIMWFRTYMWGVVYLR